MPTHPRSVTLTGHARRRRRPSTSDQAPQTRQRPPQRPRPRQNNAGGLTHFPGRAPIGSLSSRRGKPCREPHDPVRVLAGARARDCVFRTEGVVRRHQCRTSPLPLSPDRAARDDCEARKAGVRKPIADCDRFNVEPHLDTDVGRGLTGEGLSHKAQTWRGRCPSAKRLDAQAAFSATTEAWMLAS